MMLIFFVLQFHLLRHVTGFHRSHHTCPKCSVMLCIWIPKLKWIIHHVNARKKYPHFFHFAGYSILCLNIFFILFFFQCLILFIKRVFLWLNEVSLDFVPLFILQINNNKNPTILPKVQNIYPSCIHVMNWLLIELAHNRIVNSLDPSP